MASAREIHARINELNTAIGQTLQRCANLPVPDRVRYDRIAEFRTRHSDLTKRVEELYSAIGKKERGRLEAAQANLASAQQEQARLEIEIRRIDAEFQKRLREMQKEQAVAQRAMAVDPGRSAQVTSIQQRIAKEQEDHASALTPTRNELQDRQAEMSDLQSKLVDEQRTFNIEAEQLRQADNPDLSALLPLVGALLDEIGAFERELQIQTGTQILEKVHTNFASKSQAFSKSAEYHERQTRYIFWLMGVLVIVTALIIRYLFVAPDAALSSCSAPGAAPDVVVHVLLVGVGRLAALGFPAIAFRYLARLHRAHSEQAVMCRDRVAALDVAETIIGIAPYDKKVDFLKTLSDGYLSFEQNAFRYQSHEKRHPSAHASDEAIANLKATVEAMKPAFDVVKAIAEKVK